MLLTAPAHMKKSSVGFSSNLRTLSKGSSWAQTVCSSATSILNATGLYCPLKKGSIISLVIKILYKILFNGRHPGWPNFPKGIKLDVYIHWAVLGVVVYQLTDLGHIIAKETFHRHRIHSRAWDTRGLGLSVKSQSSQTHDLGTASTVYHQLQGTYLSVKNGGLWKLGICFKQTSFFSKE